MLENSNKFCEKNDLVFSYWYSTFQGLVGLGRFVIRILNNYLQIQKLALDIFSLSFEPKIERKYFCISALVSKKRSNQKNKGTLYH